MRHQWPYYAPLASVALTLAAAACLALDSPLAVVLFLLTLDLVGVFVAMFVLLSALRFARQAAASARAVSGGALDARIDGAFVGELAEAANAFNDMAEGQEELLESASQQQNRLRAALNSSMDGLVAVDASARVVFANAAVQRLFNRSEQELSGNPFVWLLPDRQIIEALRSGNEEARRAVWVIERPNQQHLQVAVTPIIGGGDWKTLVVFHDVTEVRLVEQVRRDFVANVSHELRTPLASIKSVIETLQGGAVRDEEVAEDFLSRADTEVDRLAQIVEELLELSRIESGQIPLAREQVDIRAVLDRAVERLRSQAEKQQLALAFDEKNELPAVLGDPERLERAVMNLIHNAIKFTPAGGSIRVAARHANGSVFIQISDTGVGIPADDLPRIFERFYKGDRARGGGGTGLGLAVVKHTAQAHGGSVSVNSRQGEGSTFTLSLPLEPFRG